MSLYEFIFGFSDATKAKHPHLFIKHNIDRKTCGRVVPMEVLSLGMSRTGTASMKAALMILGNPTAHGFDMHTNPRDCEMWSEAVDAKYHGRTDIVLDATFWDKLLGHVSAVTDTPCNIFSSELIDSYPKSKIILVERDVDRWYPSFERAVISNTDHAFMLKAFGYLDKDTALTVPILMRGVMNGQFRARDSIEFRENAKVVYREHYARIREILEGQPERLLEFKLDDGWEPLCRFLGKEVPDVPFPRVNEQAVYDDMLKVVYMQITQRCLSRVFEVVGPVFAGVVLWRWWVNEF